MHYYQFNIGDYAKHTRHLTLIEDLAYRRLLDLYYTSEEALPTDIKKLSRLVGMADCQTEISQVLEDFFILTDEGFTQKRVADEIAKYAAKSDAARENGRKGGRPKKPKKTQLVNSANPAETGSKANQEPRTNNHKPIDSKPLSSKPDLAEQIFGFWCEVMAKGNSKFTAKRKKAVAARIKDGYTEEDFMQAILNCSRSPFHMGENDRQTLYNDLELICRSGEKLESFRDSIGKGCQPEQKRLMTYEEQRITNRNQAMVDFVTGGDDEGFGQNPVREING